MSEEVARQAEVREIHEERCDECGAVMILELCEECEGDGEVEFDNIEAVWEWEDTWGDDSWTAEAQAEKPSWTFVGTCSACDGDGGFWRCPNAQCPANHPETIDDDDPPF